jgi:hypothetical protein
MSEIILFFDPFTDDVLKISTSDGDMQNKFFYRTIPWYVSGHRIPAMTAVEKNKLGSGFHFDADPEPVTDPISSVMLENLNFVLLIHSNASLHCFLFMVCVEGVIIFNILDYI